MLPPLQPAHSPTEFFCTHGMASREWRRRDARLLSARGRSVRRQASSAIADRRVTTWERSIGEAGCLRAGARFSDACPHPLGAGKQSEDHRAKGGQGDE